MFDGSIWNYLDFFFFFRILSKFINSYSSVSLFFCNSHWSDNSRSIISDNRLLKEHYDLVGILVFWSKNHPYKNIFFYQPLESNVSAHSISNSLTFLTLSNYCLTFKLGYVLSFTILCTLSSGNDGGWNVAVSWLGTWVQLLLIINTCSIPTHLYIE